ncbi:hypothetical protein C5F47_06835 [Nitrosopumilus cobalaminigenes]|uniref:Peptidase n=1 Tax=Nitrosopumilus cobalaminigenes TaxID=1470066 RepID=A0A7D5QZD7_9ARCH|nr:hypothetical protein [Nitrosopumilus cobalaminigenes]QLH03280.1 hypothetical protein C5F47_06835 [Nitrosopumilus cobalaminigenes]
MKVSIFSIIFVIGITLFLPQVQAQPTISIIMEKTTYSYCEKLFYTIEVSEVTGDPAIIHISDESGKGSSAIPIAITELQNPIPSLIPFDAEIFPLGKYFIDVQYSGAEANAEFELIDSDSICIPELIKPIMANWLSGNISDGFLLDAFQKYVDSKLVNVPFEINEKNVYDVEVPEWVKNIGYWWLEGVISDDDLSNAMNNLLERNIIGFPITVDNEI